MTGDLRLRFLQRTVDDKGWIAKSIYFSVAQWVSRTPRDHLVGMPPPTPARTIVWSTSALWSTIDRFLGGVLHTLPAPVITGTDPGMTWMYASGTVPFDRPRLLCKVLQRLAEPFAALMTRARAWGSILMSVLLYHPLIYSGLVQNGKP